MSTVKLGEVATECKDTYKDDKTGMPIVGLEHLTPNEVTLSNWNMNTDNTFTKMFRKDDVLFGRRRAYLKKAAVAPFNGVCSGDITVIRAKDDKLFPDLLPFIIQNDDFFDYAVGKSAGSLSPRVKWSHLQNYEFNIPDMGHQKKIAELLWSINDSRLAYQSLLQDTDALVKFRFIEMFGDLSKNNKCYDLKPLSELLLIERGGSPRPIEKYVTNSSAGVNWIKIGDAVDGSIYITHTKEKIKLEGTKKSRYVEPGDFLLSNSMSFGRPYILMIDGYIHDGWLVLRDKNHLFDKLFLYTLLSSEYAKNFFQTMANGSVVKNLNKDLVGKLLVPVPEMKLQLEFSEFLSQSDKSKFALQDSLNDLNSLMWAVISKELIINHEQKGE